MFKRKNPRPWYDHAKEWVWPTSGWGRAAQYLGHRVARIPDTPANIAAGLAFGAAISFTPFIGLHLAVSIGVAWLLRANLVAAAIGTLVGNPWTFPFIWLLTYKTGVAILGLEGGINISEFMAGFNLFENPYDYLKPVLTPLLLGSVPYILGVWVLVYFPTKRLIEIKRQRRKWKEKMAKTAKPAGPEVTKEKAKK